MEELKQTLSQNLYNLRKRKSITQLELANLLNYSDKSISKWECGETVPDIEILSKLASFYGVTVDYLIAPHSKEEIDIEEKTNTPNNKLIITLLATSVVWICATICHVQYNIWFGLNLWTLYVWSIPISSIILLTFNSIWGTRKNTFYLTSVLIWTLLISLYLQFVHYNMWVVFFIGVPFQISIILWSQLKKTKK